VIWCGSGSTEEGVDRNHRVEEKNKPESLGLGNEFEECATGAERKRTRMPDDFKWGFLVAKKKLRAGTAFGIDEDGLKRIAAVFLRVFDRANWNQPCDARSWSFCAR
jgi:hypothetical protein